MIEFGLGLLLVAAAIAIVTGAPVALLGAGAIDLMPLLGFGGVALMAALGLLLCAAGLVRRALKRESDNRHALRSARLATSALLSVGVLTLGVPFAADVLNLVRLDGFPLGYYLAAQGALIALVGVAFGWAGRQTKIDSEETSR